MIPPGIAGTPEKRSGKATFGLSKSERLCNRILFQELIITGQSFVKYPFRIILKESSQQGDVPARIAISVSKKKIKRAVQRNHIKRLTREAYRLNKADLYKHIASGTTVDLLFIYLDHQKPSYTKIVTAIQHAIQKISTQLDCSKQT